MKLRTSFLLALPFVFSACKKGTDPDPVGPATKPVDFSSSFYEQSCTWNDGGLPSCLEVRDQISPALQTYINTTLQEGKDLRYSNPNLLLSSATADIAITTPSDVFITFVLKTTGSKNAFAYYTYPTGQPPKTATDIKKITYIFPNVGNTTTLLAGDKVKLGRFPAGTSIGFILLNDAWDPATKKPNEKAVHFCSHDDLNPEVNPQLRKHAVLVNYTQENKILVGFEDANRTAAGCDHDFNDLVVYATVRP